MADVKDILEVRNTTRYNALPDKTKQRLNVFDTLSADKYQLQVIKRKRQKISQGDIFLCCPCNEIYLYGIVLKCNVSNICGDNLLVVCIFKRSAKLAGCLEGEVSINENDILIKPRMISKRYWTEGYFYTVANNMGVVDLCEYGFYKRSNGKIVDAYGDELSKVPLLVERFALTTLTGIASELHYELIIDHSFLSLEDQRTYETYLEEMLKPQMAEEKVLSEFDKEILPFSLFKEHSRRYGIILEDFEPYAGIFRQRSDELEGNGYDWEDLIKYYLKVNFPETYKRIKFDSEAGMLYMYASNETLMKEVVQKLALDLKHNRMIEYVMKAKFSDLLDD